jgi:hypothetical protein
MAAKTTLAKIHDKVSRAGLQQRTKQSRAWFIKNLKNIRLMSRKALLNDPALVQRKRPLIGRMFMFFYDPKTKETLPYYDEFPLVIMVGPAPGGFYGLNLHYLSPKLRAVFFDELMDYMTNTKYNDKTRLRLTYDLLNQSRKLRLFEPCFKRYLFSHIQSKTAEVPPTEWEIAMFMPTDSFVGATRNSIWQETKQFLNQ